MLRKTSRFDSGAPATNKILQPRRAPSSSLSADEGQNWAISYADMLMVLMAFFVIFFSIDPKNDKIQTPNQSVGTPQTARVSEPNGVSEPKGITAAKSITESTGVVAGGSEKPSLTQGQSGSKESGSAKRLNPELKDLLKIVKKIKLPISTSRKDNEFTIHLPDQIYSTREFLVNRKIEKILSKILLEFAPHREKIRIVFIGHSDDIPIKSKNLFLSSNFDLSSLRASRAISFAMKQGFDSRNLSIQAVTSDVRNTRSLSLRISPLEK